MSKPETHPQPPASYDADPAHVETIHSFCEKHGVQVSFEGHIGFGRACVGVYHGTSYVEARGLRSAPGLSNPYHKGPYMAVLGHGAEAVAELAAWCEHMESLGVTIEIAENDNRSEFTGNTSPTKAFMRRPVLSMHQRFCADFLGL
jgi:hypothetical protein